MVRFPTEKTRKMNPQWLGPYEIAADLGKGFYALSDVTNGDIAIKRVNGAHLKPYNTSSLSQAGSNLTGNLSIDFKYMSLNFVMQAASHNSLLDDSMPPLPPPLPPLKALKEGITPCASVHQIMPPSHAPTSAESPAQHPILLQVINPYVLLYYSIMQCCYCIGYLSQRTDG